MKSLYLALFLFLLANVLIAQPPGMGNKGKTYAILIGISDYADDRIDDLQFADKDVEIFSDYLQSPAGGSIPRSNIVLLTNEAATNAAMHEAFKTLKSKVQKNDKVIFYFSGHGDVESEEYNPLGYLLAYDTPYNNYETNAMQMGYLNRSAATLTLRPGREADAIFFIDACHAGELAGQNNNGTLLANRELQKKAANEVRMMSCKPEQRSIETTKYGGGRGLFSYFLIKGLMGEANSGSNPDFQISVRELSRYVLDNVEEASESLGTNNLQSPVASEGNDRYTISFIDEDIFNKFKTESIAAFSGTNFQNRNRPGTTFNLKGISKNRSIKVFDDVEYAPFDEALAANNLLGPDQNAAFEIYKNLKQSNSNDERLPALKSKLLIALQDEAQKAINAYLKGDQAELDRRIYINKSDAYKLYPTYLAQAAELAGKDHPSYNAIKAKQYYFEGVNYRLKNMVHGLSKKHLRTAMNLQKKASKYDAKTAFINNEIGVLYMFQDQYDQSGASFQKAMEIAPTWAVPYANYSIMHYVKKNYVEAEKWARKSIELQKDYLNGQIYTGASLEEQGNYLLAEQHYRNAIYYHWDHYKGFEKLSYLYTFLGEYPLADHLFVEMEIRKAGVFPGVVQEVKHSVLPAKTSSPIPFQIPSEEELLKRIQRNPNDDKAWLSLGQLYELERRFEEAETCFLKVIDIKPSTLIVYEYLGDLYAGWQKPEKYHLVSYMSSSISIDENGNEVTHTNVGPSYNGSMDTVIQWPASNWKRYEEALVMYSNPIDTLKNFRGVARSCAHKSWTLQEELERNEEAEDLMEDYIWATEEHVKLLDFYGRMISKYPENAAYWFKRGYWHYDDRIREILHDIKNDSEKNYYLTWSIINDFEKGLDLDSLYVGRADLFLKLGELYAHQTEYEHRRTFVRKNMKNNLEDSSQYKIYQLYHDYTEKAMSYSEASNTHRPEQTGPQQQLIDQYLAFFEPEKALQILEGITEKKLLGFKTRRQLIHAYSFSGKSAKAKPLVDWLLKKPIGLEKEDLLKIARYYMIEKDYQNAIQFFEKALAFEPENSDIQYRIATMYARDKKNGKALDWLERAFKNGFNHKKILYYDPSLEQLRKSGKYTDLISNYNLQADPDNKALLDEG